MPFNRRSVILPHACAADVAKCYLDLSLPMSVLGGFYIPFESLDVILLHADADRVGCPKVVLSLDVTLPGGLSVPVGSLDRIVQVSVLTFDTLAGILAHSPARANC